MRSRNILRLVLVGAVVARLAIAQDPGHLPDTRLLTHPGDLSAQMVAGIDRWLMRETERVATNRAPYWKRDFTSHEAYTNSVAPNRERLRRMIGAVDPRAAPGLEVISDVGPGGGATAGYANPDFTALPVRWPVFEGLWAEGLLLSPGGKSQGIVLAIPDADETPEMLAGFAPGLPPESQWARRLAASGVTVLVVTTLSRGDEFSGNPKLKRFTNQPHREWIYRQAYEMGRHIIGYEVQQVLAALDSLEEQFSDRARAGGGKPPLAVAGYGEGGLIALHAAALDSRLRAALVSGYFGPRESLWEEPVYRNLFGVLREFGDAEIASLVAPRKLIIEHSAAPRISGPPPSRPGRGGAAPGKLAPVDFGAVEAEVARAHQGTARLGGVPFVELIHGSEGMVVAPGSAKSLSRLLQAIGSSNRLAAATAPKDYPDWTAKARLRQQRAVRQFEVFTQRLFRESERTREQLVWSHLQSTNQFYAAAKTNREIFWRDSMGKIEAPKLPVNPRTRPIPGQPGWTGYEVMLDVLPDVFAWGYLLVPKDLQPGERRPVVVCQHGLEGLPEDTLAEDPASTGYKYYRAFAARLAERGFIVYAPHNPYRGGDKFRVLQRQANPLGLSLFSFIIAQHEVTTDWLASLPFVDARRIAFYGLSYGGKTAMRVPAVVDRYSLSICSADFNDWIQKNVTTDSPYSYMFTGEYEMPEWNLGHTFNYAEMASLIAPRPFMVERGHDDGVAPDSWVASEYAKVRRMYDKLGLGDRTELEFFNGPHRINGVGTFEFLHKHLRWPER